MLRIIALMSFATLSSAAMADQYYDLPCGALHEVADAAHIVGRLDLMNRDEGGHVIDLVRARSDTARLFDLCQSKPEWLVRHAASQLFPEIAEEEEPHPLLSIRQATH